MTTRAEKVYLSFYEGDLANGPRLARAIRQALHEVTGTCIKSDQPRDPMSELQSLCNELEDPTLLDGIYEGCYD